ncbi:MAG: hypothetical protein H6Q65_82 [Firmicutes bacterium]|nr:hypothetical protein [Bacillota bacterium]
MHFQINNGRMKSLLLRHFLICLVGLIAVIKSIVDSFEQSFLKQWIPFYYEYLSNWFFPSKKFELIFYGASILTIFFYLIIINFINKYNNGKLECNIQNPKRYYLIILTLNLILYNKNLDGSSNGLAIGIIWLIIFSFPYYYKYIILLKQKTINRIYINRIYGLIFCLLIVQFCHIMYPLVFQKVYIINEFFDIPEETIIAGDKFNNIDFFNQKRLFGINKHYDIERDNGNNSVPEEGTYAKVSLTPALAQFLNEKGHKEKFYYNFSINALCANDEISLDDYTLLLGIMSDNNDKKEIENLYLNNYYYFSKLRQKQPIDGNVKQFLENNRYEFNEQILNRWLLHHHNFVLGPINAYALGSSLDNIFMQYGWLNVIIIKSLMSFTGGITFEKYFHYWNSVYYIYYGIYIAFAIQLFRKKEYILILLLLAFSALNNMGFYSIYLEPGENPIRHFFDIIIMWFIFKFFKTQKILYMAISFLFSLIGILNNSQMGLFGFVALSVAVFTYFYNKNDFKKLIIWVPIILISGIFCYLYGKVGPDYMSSYYINGLIGYPVNIRKQYATFVIIVLGYLTFAIAKKSNDAERYIALLLLIYAQGMFIYYLWTGQKPHLFGIGSIIALLIVLFIKLAIENLDVFQKYNKSIIAGLLFLAFITYIPAVSHYYHSKREFEQVFTTHVNYEWTFDSMHVVSTANPKYFYDAVNKIHKYSPNNNICLISKYDTILPLLSNRYNDLPFLDVSKFLITNKEMQMCIDTIKRKKPIYIFVDSDIERNLNQDIVSVEAPIIARQSRDYRYVHRQSVSRVQELNLLKELFVQIKPDYEIIDKGYLISVYKRKYLY